MPAHKPGKRLPQAIGQQQQGQEDQSGQNPQSDHRQHRVRRQREPWDDQRHKRHNQQVYPRQQHHQRPLEKRARRINLDLEHPRAQQRDQNQTGGDQ